MSESQIHQLISENIIHKEYSLEEYTTLCNQIRQAIWKQRDNDIDDDVKAFFTKQFANEMEPLSKIGQHFFGRNSSFGNVRVQYVKKDPPDGKIVYGSPAEEICIEFTSARDYRLEQVVLQQNRRGIPTSTTGHTSKDISGSRNTGYKIEGYSFEVESIDDTVAKQEALISERIQKKLSKKWPERNNWLCVLIPDDEPPSDYCSRMKYCTLLYTTLIEVFQKYEDQLYEKHINALYFVGYASWISFHPVFAPPRKRLTSSSVLEKIPQY